VADVSIDWKAYEPGTYHDELISSPGYPRRASRAICAALGSLDDEELEGRRQAAELLVKAMGITFTVYGDDGGNIDRAWPFDLIPRVIPAREWTRTEEGLKQRLTALNLFVSDVYNRQLILDDGVVPRELIDTAQGFRAQCSGVEPPHGAWANVCGTDLVRDADGAMYVLEDNLRVPSGVSYMLENRQLTKRVLPELFEGLRILPVDDYPSRLLDTLASLSPRAVATPTIVVLTPGIYNSAYFEHTFLAQQMGVELVEGSDLVVGSDDCLYMRSIDGHQRVDVVYRRIDDLFLDPEVFNAESVLGVPGLMRAWLRGNVALANAPGVGVADDKVLYTYVPDMIRYYLDEDPILPNVPSYRCWIDSERQHVLENIGQLVVKPANESGGYGMVMGPQATKAELAEAAQRIEAHPRDYIAQPLVALSTAPTLVGNAVEPRHLDLRPFILQAEDVYVAPGGLTRVALRKGSYVVNSSQGGGSKDTWVVEDHAR
jgi:uncharacterized circularly permuted ATP-grasp superfamily protein